VTVAGAGPAAGDAQPAPEAPHRSPGPGGALVGVGAVDAVVAAIIFVAGAVVVVQARALGAGWTSDGPGAGYFPFYIGLILCLASAGIFVQALRKRRRGDAAFVDREQLVRVLSVLVPAIVYVLVVVFLGLYVASAIYIAVFMVVLGKYPVWKAAVAGVLVSAAFFLMFEVWFKVPLYKGTLHPLAFLGY
jgi:hypothetical protein